MMHRTKQVIWSTMAMFAVCTVGMAAEPEFPALTPQQSQAVTHLRDGFEMELMAAEPMVVDPVAIEWGPDGKLWVVEMADYPLGMDGKGKSGGRIRYLEDTNGDGKYDKSTLFMTDVNFPTGVLPWRNGVVVTAAPEIFYAADTDGDGKADVRETLYRGFIEGNTQLRVNGLQPGLDGWVYCANGWSGGHVQGEKSGASVPINGRDFRIRLEDNQVDAQSGVSEYGRNRDDWGNWFGCDNSHPLFHFVLPDHYIRRNPHAAPPDTKVQVIVPDSPIIFALSPPEKRFHSFEHSNRFTSACGTIIYRDNLLFGDDGLRHAFACEPVHNLVHHEIVSPEGSTFSAVRPAEEQESEFVASEDRWFRPVQTRTGPDGALWVVDMYRYIIEHPDWMPPEGKAAIQPFERLGDDRGRLYRVYPTGKRPRAIKPLAGLESPQLVAALDSPNGWQRDTAQQLLVKRNDPAAVAPLERLAATSENPLARLHALWTLELMGKLTTAPLEKALADKSSGVRINALRIAETRDAAELIEAAVKLANDSDAQVRLQLAFSLGAWKTDLAAATLGQLFAQHHADSLLAAAVMTSLNADNIAGVIDAVRASGNKKVPMESLLTQAAAFNRLDSVAALLETAIGKSNDDRQLAALPLLAVVCDVLEHRGISLDQLFAAAKAPEPFRDRVLKILAQAEQDAFDDSAKVELRLASIPLVGRAGEGNDALARLGDLLSPQSAPQLQQAVVAYLVSRNDPQVANWLLANWRSHTPGTRSVIIDALLRRPEWTTALLNAIEAQEIVSADLDAVARQRLTSHADADLRARAEKLLATSGDSSRKQVLADHQSVLQLTGDPVRGAALFKDKCSACHRLGEVGNEVGPNLAALTDKSPPALLTSLLDPSQAVEARYLNYIAQTSDGQSLSGLLQSETATSVTLVGQNGQRITVLRADLDALQSTGKSMMPEGLEQDLKPQDFADLMAFIGGSPAK